MELPGADRYESLPERLIREAIEAGEFDDLPGEGEPVPGAGAPDDELWWPRAWLKRNGIGPQREAHPEADRVSPDDRSR